MSLFERVRAAWSKNAEEAKQALELLRTWGDFPRVPGMDTVLRLAVRIDSGRSSEEAAAREYLYRWELALKSPIFGVPHPLGL
jgi:hypothetical protein